MIIKVVLAIVAFCLQARVVFNIPVDETIISVQANDKDEGPNGNITYTLLNQNDIFQIDSYSGNIKRREPLVNSIYRLTAIAQDAGTPPMSSSVTVEIIVESFSNKPVFSEVSYKFSLPETNKTNIVVGKLSATVQGKATVFYRAIGFFGFPFFINSSGVLLNRRALDREHTSLYRFEVEASTGRVSTKVNVTVTVEDVNDNVPVFKKRRYEVRCI